MNHDKNLSNKKIRIKVLSTYFSYSASQYFELQTIDTQRLPFVTK